MYSIKNITQKRLISLIQLFDERVVKYLYNTRTARFMKSMK